MKATRTESGWLIRSENNKEEIALMSFLREHKRVSFPFTSTDYLSKADRPRSIVPPLRPVQTEVRPPSHGGGWRQVEPPDSTARDWPDAH